MSRHCAWLRMRVCRAPAYKDKGGGPREAEEAFAAGCNARVVKGAETYYRNMFYRCPPPRHTLAALHLQLGLG